MLFVRDVPNLFALTSGDHSSPDDRAPLAIDAAGDRQQRHAEPLNGVAGRVHRHACPGTHGDARRGLDELPNTVEHLGIKVADGCRALTCVGHDQLSQHLE
jgi:hypothetical protein